MHRFSGDILDHNIELRTAWLQNDVVLTRRRDGWLITTCKRLGDEHRHALAVAMMIEVIALKWPGKRFLCRFPLSEDTPALRRATATHPRDYRFPYQRALQRIVPDRFLERMEREERSAAYACEESGVSLADLEVRVAEWRASRMRILSFPRLPQPRAQMTDLYGPIPF